ncbi:MAG: thymidylate kinase, partial [Candidatus Aenigmatarchaeota archaeon]
GLLEKRLKAAGKAVEAISFPAYSTKFGGLVGRYLAGEFGTKEEVGPEIASLLYSMDRYQFKNQIKKWLESGKTVISDRYSSSNVYQAAKLDGAEQFRLWEWAKALDSRLPKADFTIFLNVPPEVSENLFAGREAKSALVGKALDIHERDKAYQEKVRQLYLEIAKKEGWIVVDCMKGGALRKPEDIHEEIFKKLKKKGAF